MCPGPHPNLGRDWRCETNLSRPVKLFLLTVPRWCFFCGSFLLFVFRVCQALLSVQCSPVVACWKGAAFLALLCVVFCFVLSLSHVVPWVVCGT